MFSAVMQRLTDETQAGKLFSITGDELQSHYGDYFILYKGTESFTHMNEGTLYLAQSMNGCMEPNICPACNSLISIKL